MLKIPSKSALERGAEALWRAGLREDYDVRMSYVTAVLAALREPTPEMIQAGESTIFEHMAESRDWSMDATKDGWQAMIDAALK